MTRSSDEGETGGAKLTYMNRVASWVKCWPVGDELRRGGGHGIVRTLKEEKVQMTGISVR